MIRYSESFLLDIAYCAISLANKKNKFKLRPSLIHKKLKENNPFKYSTINLSKSKNALRLIFPIYNNNKNNTRFFKINDKSARRQLSKLNIILMPLDHITTGKIYD